MTCTMEEIKKTFDFLIEDGYEDRYESSVVEMDGIKSIDVTDTWLGTTAFSLEAYKSGDTEGFLITFPGDDRDSILVGHTADSNPWGPMASELEKYDQENKVSAENRPNTDGGKDMFCDDSNEIQMFYRIELYLPDHDDVLTVPEEQKPYIFDLLNEFQSSFMGKTFPLVDDQIPENVKPGNHFISFDKEYGLVLCVNFFVDYDYIHDTNAIKDILNKLNRELDGQFCDGWGENSFGFIHDGKDIYADFRTANLCKIVMPVMGHCSQFNVKWPSIESIENVEWMCGLDNGAFNMLHRPKRHEEDLKYCHGRLLEKFEYVKQHLDQFF